MRAVVAVIGKDTVGILAKVSGICAEHNANVMDVTQTIMQDLFAMTMMIEISKLKIDYIDFADKLTKAGSRRWRIRALWRMSCTRISSTQCTESDKENTDKC